MSFYELICCFFQFQQILGFINHFVKLFLLLIKWFFINLFQLSIRIDLSFGHHCEFLPTLFDYFFPILTNSKVYIAIFNNFWSYFITSNSNFERNCINFQFELILLWKFKSNRVKAVNHYCELLTVYFFFFLSFFIYL